MIEFHLCCILLILLIVLILKYMLQYSETYTQNLINTQQTKTCHDKECMCKKDMSVDLNVLLNDMHINTNAKINYAIEQGIMEGFKSIGGEDGGYGLYDSSISNSHSEDDSGGRSGGRSINNKSDGNTRNETITSYINKDAQAKLMLFYKTSCSYCTNFLPTWYKIINNLPNTVLYEEINSDKDDKSNKKTIAYNVTSVPTLILSVNNTKKNYVGNRTYEDIEKFLQKNGIQLVTRTFEEFDDSGYSLTPSATDPINKNCPAVTFDKQIDLANDVHMYQIFSDGQYGYSSGTHNSIGKSVLSPFAAAYSVVDSYLNSIPDPSKMNECANLYSKDIIGLGLCDNDNLTTILSYGDMINDGTNVPRVDGTNYDSNKNVVNAIKYACDM